MPGAGTPAGTGNGPGVSTPGTPAGAGPGGSPPPPGTPSPPPGAAIAACTPGQSTPAPRRLWLLGAGEYARTVATLFQGRSSRGNLDLAPPAWLTPLDDSAFRSEKFTNLAVARRITPDRLAAYLNAADQVGSKLVADPSIAPCAAMTGAARPCLAEVIRAKGELLFRRPLTPDEVARHVGVATSVESMVGGAEAMRLALRTLLMAPQFLFRAELGARLRDGGYGMDVFELASAISFGLTGGPPDQPLWDDASKGTLGDRAAIAGHVRRLFEGLEARPPWRQFVRELFDYRDAIEVGKDEKFHQPAALVAEADLFLDGVLKTSGRADFWRALLTSRSGLVSAATAPSYNLGAAGRPVTGATPATWTGDRQGILAHPAWLAAYSEPDHNNPITRGGFVTLRLLCGSLPAAPIAEFDPLPTDPKLTLREKLAVHTKNPTCAACHALMDPIGFSFEGFDHYGRERTTEAGRPVNRQGELRGAGADDGPVDGVGGLMAKLTVSQRALACFASNTFEFLAGRVPGPGDACAVAQAKERFVASGGDLGALAEAIMTSDAFVLRAPR
jgi:hypothetical protein